MVTGSSRLYGKMTPVAIDIIEELTWRGLIAQSTDVGALAAHLQQEQRTLYCGFDPTAPSLHLGHLLQTLTLRRFQLAGHRPLGLVGGATGLIGDPKMTAERTLNDADVVAAWVERIRSQVERFLDFDEAKTGAQIVNNYDWTKDLSAIDLLRGIGKHFSVNRMLDREAVAARLAGPVSVSASSATSCSSPTTFSNCFGVTTARCRPAVRTSGETSFRAWTSFAGPQVKRRMR